MRSKFYPHCALESISWERLQIATDFTTWLAASLSVLPVIDAPLTFEVARTLPTLSMPHDVQPIYSWRLLPSHLTLH